MKGSQYHFFNHPIYPDGPKEDLIVRFELDSSQKVVLYNQDTAAPHKLSRISLEYHTTFVKRLQQISVNYMMGQQ